MHLGRIVAKHPSFQPTTQSTDISRVAAKPPSLQSTNETFINVQSDEPQ